MENYRCLEFPISNQASTIYALTEPWIFVRLDILGLKETQDDGVYSLADELCLWIVFVPGHAVAVYMAEL